jgi:acetylglutamate kinase
MLNVIKIGGNVIDNEQALKSFLVDFSAIRGFKMLVHGGGQLSTKLSEMLDIQAQMIDGRRVTDAETLKVVTMVYAGWINKSIVAQLYANGCTALGLSGADANTIPAVKRNPLPIDYGFVGDISPARVNVGFLRSVMEQGAVPVFSAITHDTKGTLLNSNADTVASSLAIAMSHITPTRLIFCFEKKGVLSNLDDDSSVIPEITRDMYAEYKVQGIISGGMIPKVDNAFKAIDSGVKEVLIKHATAINTGGGTTIK